MIERIEREDICRSQRFSGQVTRYHAWPTIRQQTVGEHCWQVWRIYNKLFGPPPEYVTYHIIFHDSAELQTGDAPFLFKKGLSEETRREIRIAEYGVELDLDIHMMEIDDVYKNRIKVCDILEMTEFARDEILMGNRWAEPIFDRTIVEARLFSRKLSNADNVPVEDYILELKRWVM